MTATGSTVSQGDSMFIVWRMTAMGGNPTAIDGSGATNRQALAMGASSYGTMALYAGFTGSPSLSTPISSLNIVQVDWGVSSGMAQVYQNGTAQGSLVTVGTESIQLGVLGNNQGGTGPFTGNISEIIIYPKILSTNDRTRVTRYLGGRYGIAVP